MADKVIDFVLDIKSTSGKIGSIHMHVEDGRVTGVKLTMDDKWLKQEDFVAIQAAYTELKNWATTNGYTWIAAA